MPWGECLADCRYYGRVEVRGQARETLRARVGQLTIVFAWEFEGGAEVALWAGIEPDLYVHFSVVVRVCVAAIVDFVAAKASAKISPLATLTIVGND